MISLRLGKGEPPQPLLPLARRAFAPWDVHRSFVFPRESDDEAVERIARLLEGTGDPEDATHARLLRDRKARDQR